MTVVRVLTRLPCETSRTRTSMRPTSERLETSELSGSRSVRCVIADARYWTRPFLDECRKWPSRLLASLLDKPQLLESGYPVVQSDLFQDLSVFETQDGRPGEVHLATSRCRQ